MDMQVQAETGMRLFSCLKKYHLTLNPFSVCVRICIYYRSETAYSDNIRLYHIL